MSKGNYPHYKMGSFRNRLIQMGTHWLATYYNYFTHCVIDLMITISHRNVCGIGRVNPRNGIVTLDIKRILLSYR